MSVKKYVAIGTGWDHDIQGPADSIEELKELLNDFVDTSFQHVIENGDYEIFEVGEKVEIQFKMEIVPKIVEPKAKTTTRKVLNATRS